MEVGLKLKFRVRNTKTLNDYLIIGVHEWAHSVISKPAVMKAHSFMTGMQIFVDADDYDYILLSTKEEVLKAQRYKVEALVSACEKAYKINERVPTNVSYGNIRYRPFGYDRYEE